MYTRTNFKSKKDLKAAVTLYLEGKGPAVTLFAPGLGCPNDNGAEYVEGPHFPSPHRFYAEVFVKDGKVIKVK
jgi:hypothetical protein